MTLSVVICTSNGHDIIDRAIDSIVHNSAKPVELIIVDQSDDKSKIKDLLETIKADFPIRLLSDTKKGVSRARNLGWKKARSDIILFTDDDAYLDKDVLKCIRESFKTRQYHTGIAGGKIIPEYDEVNSNWSIPEKWSYVLPAYDNGDSFGKYPEGELPAGVCFAVRRDVLQKIGGFDETLGPNAGRHHQIYGEDSDVALKVEKLGFDLVYHPGIFAYHPVPLSRQNQEYFNKRLFIEGVSQGYLQLKHGKRRNRNALKLLVTDLVRFLHLVVVKRFLMDKRTYQGEKKYRTGRLRVIWKTGLQGKPAW